MPPLTDDGSDAPPAPAPGAPAPALAAQDRAAKRGAQVALMLFVLLSCAFVLSSTYQLAHAVLFEDDPPGTPPAAP